ncbi:DUF433 domain-containing protein [Candidatus Deferrimicrobium sp.]|uniref:DUF433 domain-containing protein n=1 Tax=Candidatus Deferrimicrobium sp. TaxID=3060586 RepID=UPI003C6B08B8
MEIAPRITVDEKVRFGRPVIKGTRVPVDLILGKLAGGMTYEDVMVEYGLAREDILAALNYAAKYLAEEKIRAIG